MYKCEVAKYAFEGERSVCVCVCERERENKEL